MCLYKKKKNQTYESVSTHGSKHISFEETYEGEAPGITWAQSQ